MKHQPKADIRAAWMRNFETALKLECARRGITFPAGRIDWNSPTYYFLNGESASRAALCYADAHLN
jgi:hypothetical protein